MKLHIITGGHQQHWWWPHIGAILVNNAAWNGAHCCGKSFSTFQQLSIKYSSVLENHRNFHFYDGKIGTKTKPNENEEAEGEKKKRCTKFAMLMKQWMNEWMNSFLEQFKIYTQQLPKVILLVESTICEVKQTHTQTQNVDCVLHAILPGGYCCHLGDVRHIFFALWCMLMCAR